MALEAPANPAQFWNLPGSGTQDAAAAGAAQTQAGTASNVGSKFASAASAAMGAMMQSNPVLGLASSAIGIGAAAQASGPTSLSGRAGDLSNSKSGDVIINYGSGSVGQDKATGGMSLPTNPWMLGGLAVVGLLALKIMKG